MYQTQQQSTENNRKVPKTTEKHQKHHSNCIDNSTKVLKTLQ